MKEDNGRIRVSWAQIIWAIALLVGVLGSWADLRIGQARQDEMDQYMKGQIQNNNARLGLLELRNAENGFTKADAAELKAELQRQIRESRGRSR